MLLFKPESRSCDVGFLYHNLLNQKNGLHLCKDFPEQTEIIAHKFSFVRPGNITSCNSQTQCFFLTTFHNRSYVGITGCPTGKFGMLLKPLNTEVAGGGTCPPLKGSSIVYSFELSPLYFCFDCGVSWCTMLSSLGS